MRRVDGSCGLLAEGRAPVVRGVDDVETLRAAVTSEKGATGGRSCARCCGRGMAPPCVVCVCFGPPPRCFARSCGLRRRWRFVRARVEALGPRVASLALVVCGGGDCCSGAGCGASPPRRFACSSLLLAHRVLNDSLPCFGRFGDSRASRPSSAPSPSSRFAHLSGTSKT